MSSGMNVPLYRRQTQLTRDSGARNLTAMASGSDYAAPANAAFQLGGAVAGAGQFVGDIAITEAKQENATLLASEEAKLSDHIFQVQTDAATGAVGQSKMVPNPNAPAGGGPRKANLMLGPRETQQQHLARYRSSIERQAAAQAARISDRDVRRRFTTAASQKLRTALPGIQNQLRTRYLDDHRAQMANHVIEQRRSLERHTFGGTMYNQVVEMTENFIRLHGIENNETQQNIEKSVRQFRSDVVEDHVMREALIYSEMKTPDAAKQLQREVANYASATSPYRDLSPDAAQRLQKKLSEQYRIDSRRIVADEEKRERDYEKALIKDSKAEVRRIGQAIQKARAKGEPVNFTAAQIRGNPRILPEKKEQLIKELTGDDGVYNHVARFEYKQQIRDAVTEDDLLDVERLIERDHSGNIIGNTLKLELDDYIEKRKTKTPEYEEQERYRKVVKNSLGLKTFGGMTLGPFKDDKANAKRAIQLDRFEVLIDEGMRPAEAAFTVITDVIEEDQKLAQSFARTLPQKIIGDFDFRNSDGSVRQLLPADIDAFKENWRSLFRGELPPAVSMQATQRELSAAVKADSPKVTRADRLRARELFAIESKINAISDLLKKPSLSETPAPGAKPEDSSWFGGVRDAVMGNDKKAAPGSRVR